MINILKTDFYKALRTPSFWVISVITVLFSLLLSISVFWIYTAPEFAGFMENIQLNFFQTVPTVLYECTFLIGVFAVMFTVSDFSNGTIKNIASKGYRREYMYISKFVTAIAFAVITLLFSFLTSLITAQIMVNTKIPEFFNYYNEFLILLSKYSLKLMAYISIAVFLAMLFRSLGASLSVFLIFLFLESSAIELLDKLILDIFNSKFSVRPYFISGTFIDSGKTIQGVIVLLVYMIVTTVLGIYTFRKRDIN